MSINVSFSPPVQDLVTFYAFTLFSLQNLMLEQSTILYNLKMVKKTEFFLYFHVLIPIRCHKKRST